MKRMVQWFVHWILVCPKNPFILKEVKTPKTFEFPWSTTMPKRKGGCVKIDPLSDQKTTHLHRPFHTCEFFSKNFHEWPHLNFECIVCWESSQKCEVGEVVYLTQMENGVLLWVQYFLGWGRKQCKNTRTTLKVLRSHLLYVAKWECKSRIVTHNGLMWFFFAFVGITTYRYLGFSNYLPHLSGLDMNMFFTLEISSFLVFRHMKPAFGPKKCPNFSVREIPRPKVPSTIF